MKQRNAFMCTYGCMSVSPNVRIGSCSLQKRFRETGSQAELCFFKDDVTLGVDLGSLEVCKFFCTLWSFQFAILTVRIPEHIS